MQLANHHVWYACYGSNLRAERFHAYLRGGALPDGMGTQDGATDSTRPSATAPFLTAWELHYGRHSERWGGGAAFLIAPQGDATPPRTPQEAVERGSLCRLHRISFEQFVDVFLQENGRAPKRDASDRAAMRQALASALQVPPKTLEFDLPAGLLSGGWYRRVVCLGSRGEEPVVTFTAHSPLPFEPPSEKYVRTIMIGLRETYPDLGEEEIARYLARGARADIEAMRRLAREVGNVD